MNNNTPTRTLLVQRGEAGDLRYFNDRNISSLVWQKEISVSKELRGKISSELKMCRNSRKHKCYEINVLSTVLEQRRYVPSSSCYHPPTMSAVDKSKC